MVGRMRQVSDGASHRQIGRLQNVDLVNLFNCGRANPDSRLLPDQKRDGLPPLGAQRFGVPQAIWESIRVQYHRGSDHRASHRPPANFIHPRDTQAFAPQGRLETCIQRQHPPVKQQRRATGKGQPTPRATSTQSPRALASRQAVSARSLRSFRVSFSPRTAAPADRVTPGNSCTVACLTAAQTRSAT